MAPKLTAYNRGIETISTEPTTSTPLHTHAVSYIINYTAHRYIFIHPSLEALLGYDVDVLYYGNRHVCWHMNDRKVFDEEILPEEMSFLQKHSTENYPNFSFSFNYRIHNKNRTFSTLLERFAYLSPNENGGQLIAVGTVTDITSFKEDTRIIHTIEKMKDNNTSICPIPVFKSIHLPDSAFHVLSKREIEILKSVYEGLSSKEIAEKLCISINTISNHRKNMLYKTKTNNCSELIRYAVKNGLLC
jgi:DNA-binding CsgD family transcriptional regulator